MHDKNYLIEKFLNLFCELLIVISIILTFFLLYELSLISQHINKGIIYNFILFAVLVLSVIFKGYHELPTQVARLFFLSIALVFAVFLMIYVRHTTRESVPVGIVITLVVITSVLVALSFISILACWKNHKAREMHRCRNILDTYYSDVVESKPEEEFIPTTKRGYRHRHHEESY
jgi:hypothetical protein